MVEVCHRRSPALPVMKCGVVLVVAKEVLLLVAPHP
jgi:hypothetical protein